MNTVLLTTAFGLEADELRVFLNSARRNGYDGDIVMFGDAIVGTPIGLDYLKLFFDTGVKYHFMVKKPEHFFCKRWGLFLPTLQSGKYDYAMGIDIRDCVVQTDLSEMWRVGLHVTEESANIEDDALNIQWVKEDFGKVFFNKFRKTPIICAGTVWGDRGSMTVLCDYMNKYTGDALDQGALNGAVRSRELNAIIHHNREYVWTLALEKDFGYLLQDGKMSDSKHTPSVIHQYDRHPALLQYFKRYYGV